MNTNIYTEESTLRRWFILFCQALGFAMLYELGWAKYGKFNAEWLGSEAGAKLTELAIKALERGTWEPVALILETVIIPYAATFSYLVVIVQVGLCLSLLFGIFVRPICIVGLPMFIGMNVLTQTVRTPSWFISALLVVIVTSGVIYFGLDNYLLNKFQNNNKRYARCLRFMITLNLEGLMQNRRFKFLIIGLLGTMTVISLLHMALLESHVLRLTMLEAIVYCGLATVALAVYATVDTNVSRIDFAVLFMRIKLGIAMLWTVFANPKVTITGLAGFADGQKTAELLIDVVGQSHWPPLATFAEVILAPNAEVFVNTVGILQVSIGIALIIGVKLHRIGWIAVFFFVCHCLIGFTRTTQLAILTSVGVATLGSGYAVSLDRLMGIDKPEIGMPKYIAYFLSVVATFSLFMVVFQVEIVANPYTIQVGGAVFLALALSLLPFTVVDWLKRFLE